MRATTTCTQASFHDFFVHGAADEKQACQGEVYFNEKGTPMWYSGFEALDGNDNVRETFRIHAALVPESGADTGAGDGPPLRWPSEQFRLRWRALHLFCQRIADLALSITLDSLAVTVAGFTSGDACRAEGTDHSVGYAWHYPNEEGGASTVPEDIAGEAGINVKVRARSSGVTCTPTIIGRQHFCFERERARQPGPDMIIHTLYTIFRVG